jgi:hypothetical protein
VQKKNPKSSDGNMAKRNRAEQKRRRKGVK